MRKLKEEFEHFKKTETAEAVFQKINPFVNMEDEEQMKRTRENLLEKVKDFMSSKVIDQETIEESRYASKVESSGVESLLMPIAMGANSVDQL